MGGWVDGKERKEKGQDGKGGGGERQDRQEKEEMGRWVGGWVDREKEENVPDAAAAVRLCEWGSEAHRELDRLLGGALVQGT